jgi:tagatose-6-phosphate ketose/aldose isomerase
MQYLNIAEDKLITGGAINTAREISGQPKLWKEIANQILREKSAIGSFIKRSLQDVGSIILTGAGTSSYIGLSLQGLLYRNFRKNTLSIPSTEIVTHPADYLLPDKPVLLISFARSGNSPESKAVVELADRICPKCYHLIITCDADGILARHVTGNPKYLLVLPPESNDKGLAMTGSYSGMLLSGIMIASVFEPGAIERQIDILCTYGEKILNQYALPLRQIAGKKFERAVFLGSGPFYGTAAESHLKLQELTNGVIMCKQESFLGFRHGPKAVVDANTLMGYIFSNSQYAHKYEIDLVKSIARDHTPVSQFAICESPFTDLDIDLVMELSVNNSHIDENLLSVCYILPGQILGLYKSLELGLKPDNPSTNNAISRVVEGVNIYDYQVQ